MSQTMPRNNSKSTFTPTWVVDKEFTDESTGTTVYVKRSSHRIPEYRIGTGFLIGEKGQEKPVREVQIRPRDVVVNGKAKLPSIAGRIANLFTEAEEYVEGMIQYGQDMRHDEEMERDQKKFKPAPPGLKKIGKIFDGKKARAPSERIVETVVKMAAALDVVLDADDEQSDSNEPAPAA